MAEVPPHRGRGARAGNGHADDHARGRRLGRRRPSGPDLRRRKTAGSPWIENTGRLKDGMPLFQKPAYFRQEADELKCGPWATPFAVDWDGDGDLDIICGNSAGYIVFFENLQRSRRGTAPSGRLRCRLGRRQDDSHSGSARTVRSRARGSLLRLHRHDGRRLGRRRAARHGCQFDPGKSRLARTSAPPGSQDWPPQAVEVRGTACRPRWPGAGCPEGKQPSRSGEPRRWLSIGTDGLTDLIMLDQEGYLALFPRAKSGAR